MRFVAVMNDEIEEHTAETAIPPNPKKRSDTNFNQARDVQILVGHPTAAINRQLMHYPNTRPHCYRRGREVDAYLANPSGEKGHVLDVRLHSVICV